MKNWIICLDIDGTLLDAEGRIHPQDLKILKNGKHPLIVPTTGRPLHSLRKVFQRHGLYLDGPLPFPLVLQNGAQVYLPGEKLLEEHCFPTQVQSCLMQVFLNTPWLTFTLFSGDQVQHIWATQKTLDDIERIGLVSKPYEPDGENRRLTKVMAMTHIPQRLERFARELDCPGAVCTPSLSTLLEIMPTGVDKAIGLMQALEAAGIEDHQLIVVGDGENDLPLFELAKHRFVPLTGAGTVRAQADYMVDQQKTGILMPLLKFIAWSLHLDRVDE